MVREFKVILAKAEAVADADRKPEQAKLLFDVQKQFFDQGLAFQSAMASVAQLFGAVTGGVWIVLAPNTFQLPLPALLLAYGLHIVLGGVVFCAVVGLGANWMQRLNLNRWIGRLKDRPETWNSLGGYAWHGVPETVQKPGWQKPGWWKRNFGAPECADPQAKDKNLKFHCSGNPKAPLEFRVSDEEKFPVGQDHAVARWPTLRTQRWAWAGVPVFAVVGSVILALVAWSDDADRGALCRDRFAMLENVVDRIALDRARYILDKANCDIVAIWAEQDAQQRMKAANAAATPPTGER